MRSGSASYCTPSNGIPSASPTKVPSRAPRARSSRALVVMMMPRPPSLLRSVGWRLVPLNASAARDVYDRIGRLQDSQRFYEDAATRRLAEVVDFATCESALELGCGTGRYGAYLLATRLPPSATYLGLDVSPRMVALARERLARWSDRA